MNGQAVWRGSRWGPRRRRLRPRRGQRVVGIEIRCRDASQRQARLGQPASPTGRADQEQGRMPRCVVRRCRGPGARGRRQALRDRPLVRTKSAKRSQMPWCTKVRRDWLARTASPAEIRRRAWCRGAVVPDAGARSGAAGAQVRVLAELGLAGQLRGEVEVSQRHGDRDASRALAMPASMEHLPEPTSCPSRHGLVVQRASCSDEPSATTPSTPTLLTRPKRWGRDSLS